MIVNRACKLCRNGNGLPLGLGLVLGACLAALPGLAHDAAGAPELYRIWSHGGGVELIDPEDNRQKLQPLPDAVLRSDVWEVQVDYLDDPGVGFNDFVEGPERRARLQDALVYVMDVLRINPELGMVLRVEVRPSLLRGNAGFISQGGTLYGMATNFTNGIAFLKLTTGAQPYPDYPEISLRVDFGHNWYAGTGMPDANQFDLQSVLLHEITHALGIATSSDAKGQSQLRGLYTYWDSLLFSRFYGDYLFDGDPVAFQLPVSALINPVEFQGIEATRAYGQGSPPPIYAPSLFQQGSSLSHWDTGRLEGDAVMVHAFKRGAVQRRYSKLDLAALYDIGYDTIDPTVGEGEGEGEGEDPDPPVLHVFPVHHVGITFGDVPIRAYNDGLWRVENQGGGILRGEVTVLGKGFSVVGDPTYRLTPGERAAIVIRFTPERQGEYSGVAIFDNNVDPSTIQVALLGEGAQKLNLGCYGDREGVGATCARPWTSRLWMIGLMLFMLFMGLRKQGY